LSKKKKNGLSNEQDRSPRFVSLERLQELEYERLEAEDQLQSFDEWPSGEALNFHDDVPEWVENGNFDSVGNSSEDEDPDDADAGGQGED
jgi:hypothetical protein